MRIRYYTLFCAWGIAVTALRPLTVQSDEPRPQTPVRITCDVEDSYIYIDGKLVGSCGYNRFEAAPGSRHQLTIKARGYRRFEQPFTIDDTPAFTMSVTLIHNRDRALGYTFAAMGLLSAGFGGIFTYKAAKLGDQIDRYATQAEAVGNTSGRQALYNDRQQDASDRWNAFTAGAVASYTIGGALGIISGLFFYRDHQRNEQNRLQISTTPTGLALSF